MIGPERFREVAERRRRDLYERTAVYNQPLTLVEEALVEILAQLPRARVTRLVIEAAKLRQAHATRAEEDEPPESPK